MRSDLPDLLAQLRGLHRQHVEIEHQAEILEREILAGASATLLAQLRDHHRKHVEIELQIAHLEREIITDATPSVARGRHAILGNLTEPIKAAVKVLRDAESPLPPTEIARRLGVTRDAVRYYLEKAVAMRVVENVGGGLYRATNVVPAF